MLIGNQLDDRPPDVIRRTRLAKWPGRVCVPDMTIAPSARLNSERSVTASVDRQDNQRGGFASDKTTDEVISTVSAAVRARERDHVSRQCEQRERTGRILKTIRERLADRLSGLALNGGRARELWPDIEDVGPEQHRKT